MCGGEGGMCMYVRAGVRFLITWTIVAGVLVGVFISGVSF